VLQCVRTGLKAGVNEMEVAVQSCAQGLERPVINTGFLSRCIAADTHTSRFNGFQLPSVWREYPLQNYGKNWDHPEM
jgi:hypothetical protein